MIGKSYGSIVVYLNIFFTLCLLIPLIIFHFYKNKIENYGFFSQISIVTITSVKVYFMGGMLLTGTPVYVGFLAPIFALIFPDKKRAVYIFLIYLIGMVLATILNPYSAQDHLFAGQFLGFFIGTTFIFLTLFYFTTQLEKTKKAEIHKATELDELKTKFFTHIAHEFRTPLSIIMGNADRMKKEPEKWLKEGHEIINRNANDLVNLSNKLLTLSKLEANSMPLNPIQDNLIIYLQYLIESFQSLANIKDIELGFSSTDDEIIMDFDPDKIHDIISNLISNAIKFTPKKGSIQVTATTEMISNQNNLVLRIIDNGIGIPTEQISNIFNRYYQAENHLQALKQGAGLGLALTKEFVNLHGGEIYVASNLGKGSTFIIHIPITNNSRKTHFGFQLAKQESNQTADSNQKVVTSEMSSTNQKHFLNLLIIEDNLDVASYLKSLLSKEYNIFIANDGKEGFDKALQIIPDLIISDVMMPKLDGFSLCKQLKNDIRTSHIPIILLTALADQNSKLDGLGVGADAYLAKPFNTKELFVRIDKLISLRKSLRKHYKHIISDKNLVYPSKNVNKEETFINKVRQILEDNLADEDFGINQLCDNLAMSRSQLYRKFSSLTDLTVHQFIMTLKLQKAKDLLVTTDLNVSEVALDTGFKNISHFSRVFTQEFGKNPSKFKVEKHS